MTRLRRRLIGVTIVSACGFSATVKNSPTDAPVADAGPCDEIGVTCAGDELRRCVVKGNPPETESCAWGCIDDGNPHCGVVTPGGGLQPTDLVDNPMVMSKTLDGEAFNTDTGAISDGVRSSGSGVRNGIEFTSRNNVGVFRFRNVTLSGSIDITGSNAIAIVALGTITITGTLDLTGGCSGSDAGPGGTMGGSGGSNGGGAGGGQGGQGGSNACSGGGGGSYGTSGGQGGSSGALANPAPGTEISNPTIATLVGGGGGGGGGGSGSDRGRGGGGGGAIQLFALEGIVVNGTINASGCGGKRGSSASCGGGGGAGGAILIEGKTLSLGSNARLVVNGGGGGGGNDGSSGSNGRTSKLRAAGGNGSGGNAGSGGSGAADEGLVGLPGENAAQEPGGGGGGVGWMRFHTRSGTGTYDPSAICSPDFSSQSTTSEGKLTVQ